MKKIIFLLLIFFCYQSVSSAQESKWQRRLLDAGGSTRFNLKSVQDENDKLKLIFWKQQASDSVGYIQAFNIAKAEGATGKIDVEKEVVVFRSKEGLDQYADILDGGMTAEDDTDEEVIKEWKEDQVRRLNISYFYDPFENFIKKYTLTAQDAEDMESPKLEGKKAKPVRVFDFPEVYDKDRDHLLTIMAVKKKAPPEKNHKREYVIIIYNSDGSIKSAEPLKFEYPRQIVKYLILRDEAGKIENYILLFSDYEQTRKKLLDPTPNRQWYVRLSAEGKVEKKYQFTTPKPFFPHHVIEKNGDVYCFSFSGFKKGTGSHTLHRLGRDKDIFHTTIDFNNTIDTKTGQKTDKKIIMARSGFIVDNRMKDTRTTTTFNVNGIKIIDNQLFVYGQKYQAKSSFDKILYNTYYSSFLIHANTNGEVQKIYYRSDEDVFLDNDPIRALNEDYKKQKVVLYSGGLEIEEQLKFPTQMDLAYEDGQVYWMLSEPFSRRESTNDNDILRQHEYPIEYLRAVEEEKKAWNEKLAKMGKLKRKIYTMKGYVSKIIPPEVRKKVIPVNAQAYRRPFVACINTESGKVQSHKVVPVFISHDAFPFYYANKSVYMFGRDELRYKHRKEYVFDIRNIKFEAE